MADLVEADFGDQKIEINNNNNTTGVQNKSIEEEKQKDGSADKNLDTLENKITSQVISEKDKLYKSWIDKYLCCFNFLKTYFQLTSNDFFKRIINSLIPFNSKFKDLIENNPDLYGPFWIYTALILFVSAFGSLTRSIQGNKTKNFFQDFIPVAALIIYCIGFGIPILITFLMKIFGVTMKFMTVICTYGYSYSVFLPIVIICTAPYAILQWLLLTYAIFSSTSLIVVNYYKTISSVGQSRKLLIMGIIVVFQIFVLLLLKLYFFKRFTEEVFEKEEINNNQEGSVTNNITNIGNLTDMTNTTNITRLLRNIKLNNL